MFKIKIFLIGYAGNGKSTFGNFLSDKYNIPVIDKDSFSSPFHEKLGEKSSRDLSSNLRECEYEGLKRMILDNKKLNLIVIAPFLKEVCDSDWVSDIDDDMLVVWLDNSKFEYDCIVKRGSDRDASKLDDWNKYLNERPDIEFNWEVELIKIQNNNSDDVKYVLTKLDSYFL